MSDEVRVPYGDNAEETATLLLAAVEESGEDPSVVRTSSFSSGGREFLVPESVAKKAGVDYDTDETRNGVEEASRRAEELEPGQELGSEVDEQEKSRKSPAKKSTAKKSTAKKSTSKGKE